MNLEEVKKMPGGIQEYMRQKAEIERVNMLAARLPDPQHCHWCGNGRRAFTELIVSATKCLRICDGCMAKAVKEALGEAKHQKEGTLVPTSLQKSKEAEIEEKQQALEIAKELGGTEAAAKKDGGVYEEREVL